MIHFSRKALPNIPVRRNVNGAIRYMKYCRILPDLST